MRPVRMTNNDRDIRSRVSKSRQRRVSPVKKILAEKQILRGISGNRKFRKDNGPAPKFRARAAGRSQHLVDVRVDITNGKIELRDCNRKAIHRK